MEVSEAAVPEPAAEVLSKWSKKSNVSTDVMRALRHLRGLARSIYSRAMLAQVKVVSIVVFYARVTCIDSECLKRMQTALDDYIWLSNAPESVRHADKGRRVQRHVKASAVYSPVENGGLPVQRLDNMWWR